MAFIVSMGIYKGPFNKINKTYIEKVSYTCTVKNEEGINIMTPTLIIKDFDISNNYCFIRDFKRYYYVKSVNINRTGLYEVELKEDVLMSNKTGILNSEVRLSRSADFRNYYLEDNKLPVTNNKIITTRVFPYTVFDGETHGVIATILGPQ